MPESRFYFVRCGQPENINRNKHEQNCLKTTEFAELISGELLRGTHFAHMKGKTKFGEELKSSRGLIRHAKELGVEAETHTKKKTG